MLIWRFGGRNGSEIDRKGTWTIRADTAAASESGARADRSTESTSPLREGGAPPNAVDPNRNSDCRFIRKAVLDLAWLARSRLRLLRYWSRSRIAIAPNPPLPRAFRAATATRSRGTASGARSRQGGPWWVGSGSRLYTGTLWVAGTCAPSCFGGAGRHSVRSLRRSCRGRDRPLGAASPRWPRRAGRCGRAPGGFHLWRPFRRAR